MSEAWVRTFLMDNGHVLLLWTKKANLLKAMESLVSTGESIDEIHNFFGVDLKEVLWQYILMTDDEQKLLSMFVKAKHNALRYMQRKN